MKDRTTSLNSLEEKIAEIEYHPICHIKLTPLLKRPMGGYNTVTKDITINSSFIKLSNYNTYCEVIYTLIHKGHYAYQDYNVNVADMHLRHSEVKS